MLHKKTNWILSIIIVLSIAAAYLGLRNQFEKQSFRWDQNYNLTRKSFGIPVIPTNWVIHEVTLEYAMFSSANRYLNTWKPTHFSKELFFKDSILIRETDDFHYETKDSLASRLVYEFSYLDSTWNCEMITYFRNQYPSTKSTLLTLYQADSIMTKWGMSR